MTLDQMINLKVREAIKAQGLILDDIFYDSGVIHCHKIGFADRIELQLYDFLQIDIGDGSEQKALKPFMDAIQNNLEMLSKLSKFMENHMDVSVDSVNYGDVGSAKEVSQRLDDIMQFLNI